MINGTFVFILAYPFVCVFLVLFFLFCDDHQYLVWANEVLDTGSHGDNDDNATALFFKFAFFVKLYLLKIFYKVYLLPFLVGVWNRGSILVLYLCLG